MPDATEEVRYVVLSHGGVPEPHFDLMFETDPGGMLLTWRTLVWPITEETALVRLGEHRRDYLDYEGPLTDGRGYVNRIAGGNCTVTWTTRHDFTLRLADRNTLRLQHLDDDHWLATPQAERQS